MLPAIAFAQGIGTPIVDGTGTVKMTMLHEYQEKLSMCDVMFAEKADVLISGDTAVIKMYVAYPVPAFPMLGTDGTVKNFKIMYQGKEYLADSDITSKPLMITKTTNPGFGLTQGKQISA